MKTPEELNALKEEVETLNKKLAELTEEELAQVAGGGFVDDVRSYADALTNPDWAYQSTLYRKDPNPLGDVT